MTKQVYRIEANGKGIYCRHDGFSFNELNRYTNKMAIEHTWDNLRPDGGNDGLEFAVGNRDCKFACPSLELLQQWFEGHLENLLKFKGVKVWEIEAEEIVLGDSGLQCVFRKEIRRQEINVFTGEYTRTAEEASEKGRGKRLSALSKKVIASISKSYS